MNTEMHMTIHSHPSIADNPQQAITRSECLASECLDFLPHYFGNACIAFENRLYAFAQFLLPEYTGGQWSFHHLSNKGCLSVLERDKDATLLLVSPNGLNARMDAVTASIAVNLMALSDLSFATHQNPRLCGQVSRLFHALRDYALEQPNASEILAAID